MLVLACSLWGDEALPPSPSAPRLLLTPQRLKRLKRDRERQTVRWQNFEQRVQNEPNSPERGFELALYYAVTGNAKAGRAAVEWLRTHPADMRQQALVLDWCPEFVTNDDRKKSVFVVTGNVNNARVVRDNVFGNIAIGNLRKDILPPSSWNAQLSYLRSGNYDAESLYAIFELIDVYRTNFRTDLREQDPKLFSDFPVEYLLSMKPEQLERPNWKLRMAGLAMVTIDPNLPKAQFVQGWAMEEPRMVRDGPGVAYELLWANPYLPGLSYYNLDPWSYDPKTGRLFARNNWDDSSCWIGVAPGKVDAEHCPANWRNEPISFGSLTLKPLPKEHCVKLSIDRGKSMILWQLRPGEELTWKVEKRTQSGRADEAGLFQVPVDFHGKICRANGK